MLNPEETAFYGYVQDVSATGHYLDGGPIPLEWQML